MSDTENLLIQPGDQVRLRTGDSRIKVTEVSQDGKVWGCYVKSLIQVRNRPIEDFVLIYRNSEKGGSEKLAKKINHRLWLLNQAKKKPLEENQTKTQKESIMTNIQKQVTEIGQSVLNDHEKIAKITVGRVLYENIRNVVQGYVKISWFQKLFMSKSNIKLVELTTAYGVLKVIQNKYDHYIIECVSLYLASELQHNLLSAIPLDIENLLKPVIKK